MSTDSIADSLASLVDGITNVNGRKYAPPGGDVDSLPAGVVYAPAIERTRPDFAEDHLGANDWRYTFPVVLYFDASDIGYAQSQAVTTTDAFIAAVDANQTLTATVQEAKVVRTEDPEIIEHNSRPALQVRTTVEILTFV